MSADLSRLFPLMCRVVETALYVMETSDKPENRLEAAAIIRRTLNDGLELCNPSTPEQPSERIPL